MEFLDMIINSVKSMNFFTIIDILVVAYIFYKIYMLIKESRAEQLLKGILLILILIPISDFLNLTMLNWLLNNALPLGVISIVIIFQPEIRRALEHLGRSAFNERFIMQNDEKLEEVIDEIVIAVDNLASTKTGALIVIEQKTGLKEVINTGTMLDSLVSSVLLENIFVVNTPLHDGATIIKNDRIVASACFLPLSIKKGLNKKLGTRHRAAIGISEISDAISIVVSEETGIISLAVDGKLTRNYNKENLKYALINIVKNRKNKKITFKERVKSWIRKNKTNL